MCNHENRERAMEVVERDASGKPTIWCDPCIYRLVKALNQGGLRTVASCCGHGEKAGVISLADGRELLILPNYESTRMAERAIGPLKAKTPKFSRAAKRRRLQRGVRRQPHEGERP